MSDTDDVPTVATIVRLAEQLSAAEKSRVIAAIAKMLAQEIETPATENPNAKATTAITTTGAQASGVTGSAGKLSFVQERGAFPWLDLLPNGVDGVSGEALLSIDALGASVFAQTIHEDEATLHLHQARATSDSEHLGLVHGYSYDRLDEAGWAIIVSSEDSAELLVALEPLIAYRCQEQGIAAPTIIAHPSETCAQWLARQGADINRPMAHSGATKIPIFIYRPGESCSAWLTRHGVSARAVDPTRGVPFYLMLVGRPGATAPNDRAYIPFEFQYQLDLFWGVGRLCFTQNDGTHDIAAYRAYAEQLVAYEQHAIRHRRNIAYFAPEHDLDQATAASMRELIRPLVEGVAGQPSVADRYAFQQNLLLEDSATRTNLADLLSGEQNSPSLLFAAGHGVGFPSADQRLLAYQGSLVCQEWTGYGSIVREHWFSADDVPATAGLSGLIAILFGCYSLGCPEEDQFTRHASFPSRAIAPYAFVSRLPQRLLRQGALAVFGHVDRAWTYSFRGHTLGSNSHSAHITYAQSQAFEDLLARIMDGKRMGYATDQFNNQQGAIATDLAALVLQHRSRTGDIEIDLISLGWAVYSDLRSYALLGDPAVRLILKDE